MEGANERLREGPATLQQRVFYFGGPKSKTTVSVSAREALRFKTRSNVFALSSRVERLGETRKKSLVTVAGMDAWS